MADYIDREALLKEIDEAIESDGLGNTVGQTMKRYLERQPTANVAPVKIGSWKIKIESDGSIKNKCSECGDEEPDYYGIPAMCCMLYCPSCGAKMDNFTEQYWD